MRATAIYYQPRAAAPPALPVQRPHLAGRFKAFPIQADEHFLAVLRYVERNALRARLVKRAEDWAWGSLRPRLARGGSELLASLPVDLPRSWKAAVNEPQTEAEVAAIRHSIQHGTPFGDRGRPSVPRPD